MNRLMASCAQQLPKMDIRATFSLVNTLNEHKRDGYETDYILQLMWFCVWNEAELADVLERWREDKINDFDFSDPDILAQYEEDQERIFAVVTKKRSKYYEDWLDRNTY